MAILNRGTLILMGCAIAFGGAVLLLENRPKAENSASSDAESELVSNASQDTGKLMFPFAEADVESFKLSRPNETLTFSKDKDGFWQMSSPQVAPAEEGAIAFLLNQLTSTSARSLEVAPATLERFGLAEPEATIDLVANGQPYQFLVGDADFTGDRRYVRAIATAADEQANDKKTAETVEIHLVSGSITNAVNRPTEEWLASAEPDKTTKPAEAKSGSSKSPTATEGAKTGDGSGE